MTLLSAVAVTATTEIIRGVLRVRANASYTDAMVQAGLRPYILPVIAASKADSLLDGMDGLLLTGGEDVDPRRYDAFPHPRLGDIHLERDALELALVLAAQARRMPILAICRGIQVVNVALGGTLIQDIPTECPNALEHDGEWARSARVHDIGISAGSKLAAAAGTEQMRVNSFHHQSVGRLADGLEVVARAPDGVIEGVEWTDDRWWMVGVQWHPEELIHTPETWDRALFSTFAAELNRTTVSSGDASALRSSPDASAVQGNSSGGRVERRSRH
ncbi:MAG: gamma-glutamyl-gamma-aminobutyrate hydrolase family protein [bacterium]